MTPIKNKIYLSPADQLSALPEVAEADFNLKGFLDKAGAYFNKKHAYLTEKGRAAISGLLDTLKLTLSDEIYITTTFDYPNISSCVTCTIFNFCKPSRVLTENTKAIFIIHEFGVPHPKTFELINAGKKRNIPVIEDCAHTINSYFDNGQKVGSVADWTIVSFPKIFPVHIGGLLIGNDHLNNIAAPGNDVTEQAKIVNSLWDSIPSVTTKRIELFNLYKIKLADSNYGFIGYELKNMMPWFFPMKAKEPGKLMNALRQNNIECGRWHGTNIIVLPLHQYLDSKDIDYICNIVVKNQ